MSFSLSSSGTRTATSFSHVNRLRRSSAFSHFLAHFPSPLGVFLFFFLFSFFFFFSMVMDDNESCGSRVHDKTSTSSPVRTRQHRQKLEVYNEVLRRLKNSNNDDAIQPGFDDELWAHFNRLPSRYFCPIVSFSRLSHFLVCLSLIFVFSLVNTCLFVKLLLSLRFCLIFKLFHKDQSLNFVY